MLVPVNVVVVSEVQPILPDTFWPAAPVKNCMAFLDQVPVDLPGDKKFFSSLTKQSGGHVLCGKNTYHSMPVDSMQKSGRRVHLLSRSGVTLDAWVREHKEQEGFCWVAGGKTLYQEAPASVPFRGEVVVDAGTSNRYYHLCSKEELDRLTKGEKNPFLTYSSPKRIGKDTWTNSSLESTLDLRIYSWTPTREEDEEAIRRVKIRLLCANEVPLEKKWSVFQELQACVCKAIDESLSSMVC